MCGIAGVLYRDPSRAADTQMVATMCDVIAHRGPDDSGVFAAGSLAMGMRRLSIIDLAGGHQPMHSLDQRHTIVFNGEIYNHRAVRARLEASGHRFRTSSDTEVILEAYREWGPGCLDHLNGMFAIALWDRVDRSLFLARDRVGIKPLYLHENDERLLFASEIKSLLTWKDTPREIDSEALRYFLRYGYVPSSTSLLKGVRQLLPGEYMLRTPDGTVRRSYWQVDYTLDRSPSDAEWTDRVYSELRNALQRQLISDVPLGAFLSGGLDSSSLVSLMSEVTGTQVSTYSIGFEGEDSFHSELDDARRVAQHFGTQHHEIVVKPDAVSLISQLVYHLDQPLADSSFLVTYLVSTLASQTVKVIISGVGGDEIFGGYRRYLGPSLSARYQSVPRSLRRGISQLATRVKVDRGSRMKNLARLGRAFVMAADLPPYEQYDHAVEMLPATEVERLCPDLPTAVSLFEERRRHFDSVETADPVTRLQHLDLKTSLVDSLLLLTDKMTMATSLEARVPFLDHELIETVARIPADLKVRGTTLRYIQKQAMQNHLPSSVFRGKKRGFGCPVGRWFRSELRELVADTLAPHALKQDGLFDVRAVEAIVNAHQTYQADRSETLLALLTFQLWRRQLSTAASSTLTDRVCEVPA